MPDAEKLARRRAEEDRLADIVEVEEDQESMEDDDDEEEGEDEYDAPDLSQFLVTEDGVPLVDVMVGVAGSLGDIQLALDQQNKILFRLAKVLETRLPIARASSNDA